MIGGNVRFDDELHRLFAAELGELAGVARITLGMFLRCYPDSTRGPEAKVRRSLHRVLRDLKDAQRAAEELQEREAME